MEEKHADDAVKQRQSGLIAILHWLMNLFQLTEEEQKAAGVYFGSSSDRSKLI